MNQCIKKAIALGTLVLASSVTAAAINLKADAEIAPDTGLSGASLTDRLLKGGLVIYVRHERATREVADLYSPKTKPGCEQSNNMSLAGGGRAVANRLAIEQLKLPIARVFSSPYCRSTETATLMFGVAPELTYALDAVHATATRTPETMRRDAIAFINKEAMPAKNIALVGHREGILALTDADLNTGEAVILEPVAGAAPRVVGFMSSLRWTQLASDAARRETLARTAAAGGATDKTH